MKVGWASAMVVILLCGPFAASGAETKPGSPEVESANRYTLDMEALWFQAPVCMSKR